MFICFNRLDKKRNIIKILYLKFHIKIEQFTDLQILIKNQNI